MKKKVPSLVMSWFAEAEGIEEEGAEFGHDMVYRGRKRLNKEVPNLVMSWALWPHDFSQRGFFAISKYTGKLALDCAKLQVRSISFFHGLSYCFKASRPGLFEILRIFPVCREYRLLHGVVLQMGVRRDLSPT